MKNYKVILLDLGGVVFQSTGDSNQKINWPIISKLNHKYGHDLNVGKDKFPDFMDEYNALTNQQLKGEEFLKEVFDTLAINSELIEMASSIGDIVIVSDNYRENIAYISERYHFASWAVKQIYSFDYSMVKSNLAFFKKLLKELEPHKAEDMLFIDDSLSKLESAKASGIQGVLYKDNDQVKDELSAMRWP
ncbi:MAG: hypothetical protein AAF242_11415 [Bacteroidota bacterium]